MTTLDFESDGYLSAVGRTRRLGPDGLSTPKLRAELSASLKEAVRLNALGLLVDVSYYALGHELPKKGD